MSCVKPVRALGMVCPDCAIPMQVVRTRPSRNVISRRRYCPQCGKRVTTQERPVTVKLS